MENSPFDSPLEKRSIWIFLGLAYSISWVVFYLEQYFTDFLENSIITFVLETITKFGPSLAGIFIVWYLQSRGSELPYFSIMKKQLVSSPKSIVVAFLIGIGFAFSFNLLAVLLTVILEGVHQSTPLTPSEVFVQALYFLQLRIFFGGGMGEELGYRGYLLPRLQYRFGVNGGSLLLGLIWTFWHLPANLAADNPVVQITAQLVFTVSIAFIMTAMYNRSGSSLWLMIAFHGALNGWSAYIERSLFPQLDDSGFVVFYILTMLFAGMCAAVYNRRFSHDLLYIQLEDLHKEQ